MSTTVTYKGNTLTSVENQTKILNTAGKYMEDNITIVDETSSGSEVLVVDTPDANGGTIREITTTSSVNLQEVKNYTLTTSHQTITPDTGYDGFKSVEVTSEVREDLTDPKDVDFIDYDGRLVYSYTAAEFLELTELPPNPINPGLVAQGWNWTLADAKEFVADYGSLVIGQSYTTSDGKTRYYLTIPSNARVMTVTLWLTSTVKGSPTISWGDGQTSTWNGTANVNTNGASHTYSEPGNYIIELEVTEGSITSLGRDGVSNSILGQSAFIMYGLTKVEIGDNVTAFAKNVFKWAYNLESVSIPTTLVSTPDYDEPIFCSVRITGIVFPLNFTTVRYRAWTESGTMRMVKYISIPKGMKNFQLTNYPMNLRKFTMYSSESSTNILDIKPNTSYGITHYIVMGTYTTIQTDTLRSSLVRKLYIPSTVTSIANTAFAYNYFVEEVHLRPETPPTLANVYAFRDIGKNAGVTTVFYVPYSADHSILEAYQTATNWSTYASQMQEEPQS